MLFERFFSHFGSIKSNHPISDDISHDLTFNWSLQAFRKENNSVYLLKEKWNAKMCMVVTGNLLNGVTSTGATKVNCCKSFNPVLAQSIGATAAHVILPLTNQVWRLPQACISTCTYRQTYVNHCFMVISRCHDTLTLYSSSSCGNSWGVAKGLLTTVNVCSHV